MNRMTGAALLCWAGAALAACGPTARTPSPARTATPASTASGTAAPQLPPAPQHRIALLGDGLIDGWGLPTGKALPALLAAARPDLLVLDFGLGTESSDKVLTRDRDASEQHLDAVVIWVGTFDAAGAKNSPEQYAATMAQILDDFGRTPVLLLPPVTLPDGPDAGPYAEALAAVAAKRGITPLDITGVMRSADWQSDGHYLGASADLALADVLRPKLPAPAPEAPHLRRAVLVGDSLTYGAGLDTGKDLPSVVRSLRPDLDVIDVGVGGQRSSDVLGRVRQITSLHADVVVVWLGGQDADEHVDVADFSANMAKLVDALQPARVVLVTPIPDYNPKAAWFAPYAAATRSLAQERNLTLLDLPAFPRSAYQSDGTHPAAAAEAQVAQQYAKAI